MARPLGANAPGNERAWHRAVDLAARALPYAVGGVFVLFLALSFFAHPADDDFCFTARVRELGFLDAQKHWYQTWSGRYAATAALSAFGLAGDLLSLYPWGAVLALLATLASAYALVASARPESLSRPATALAATTLTVLFVTGTPDQAQTFYWLAGSFTFQLGNATIMVLAAVLVWRERHAGKAVRTAAAFIVAALCATFAIGSNEVALVLVLLILGGGTVFAWRGRRASRAFWLALFLVAIVAATIAVTAPGNVARASGIGSDGMLRLPGWLAVLAWAPWTALRMLNWLANPALWAAGLIVLAATLPVGRTLFAPEGRFDARWLAVPVIWIVTVFVLSAIGFAVNRYPLPERAESVVYLTFLLGGLPSLLVLAHWAFGARLAAAASPLARYAPACLLVALLGSPAVVEAGKDTYRGYRYARELDARYAALRAAAARGETHVVVASLSRPPRTLFATDVTTDPRNHRNRCASQYFGVQSIRLGSPPS